MLVFFESRKVVKVVKVVKAVSGFLVMQFEYSCRVCEYCVIGNDDLRLAGCTAFESSVGWIPVH